MKKDKTQDEKFEKRFPRLAGTEKPLTEAEKAKMKSMRITDPFGKKKAALKEAAKRAAMSKDKKMSEKDIKGIPGRVAGRKLGEKLDKEAKSKKAMYDLGTKVDKMLPGYGAKSKKK